MVSGESRPGAGRKKGEPTQQVRIPVRGKAVARGVVDIYLDLAQQRLDESMWYQTCPVELRDFIKLTLESIEIRHYTNSGHPASNPNVGYPVKTLIAIARDETIGEEHEIAIPLTLGFNLDE